MKGRLEIGERIIALKTKQKRIDDALQKALSETDTVEQLNVKCTEFFEKEDKKRINVKLSTEYKEFKQQMNSAFGGSNVTSVDDEDVAEVMEPGGKVVSMFDPWSKALMLNPVRNIKCGHHYERDSVNAIIKDNCGIRCPVVGCASKCFIQPNHLEPDMALRDKIRAYKAEQELSDSSSEEE